MKPQIQLRLIVVDIPAGVVFAVQRGRSGLLSAASAHADRLVFEFPVSVADLDTQPPRFTGEFTQGPANQRFVYLNSGTLAGQLGTRWTRRAKIPLYGIDPDVLRRAMEDPSPLLEATISGRARDGGPACASVPLLTPWAQP